MRIAPRICFALHAVVCLAFASIAAGQPASPEPASDTPEGLFKVRPENATLMAEATREWTRAAEPVKSMADKRSKNLIAGISPKEIGEGQAATVRLRRLGERLANLGEPAGVDLMQRANEYVTEISACIKAVRDLPGSREKLAAAMRTEFIPSAQKGSNKLGAIARLAQQGKWEQAEKDFFELYDPLEAMAMWYDGNETTSHMAPFANAHKTLQDQLLVERRGVAEKALTDLRKSAQPDLAALVKQVQDAAQPLAAQGKVDHRRLELSGPEALGAFGREWQMAQAAGMRTRSLSWALQQVTARVQGDLPPFENAFLQAAAQMPAALAGLIDADARRATPAEVPALYGEYLNHLAPLIAASSDGALAAAAEPALDRLAARSPEFAGHVQAYRQATGDLLRWRRRVAQQAAARAMKAPQVQPLEVRFVEAARPAGIEPGIIPTGAVNTTNTRIQGSIPRTMPSLGKIVGANVTFGDLAGSSTGKASSKYGPTRVYASVPGSTAALAPYLPLLEYDMLISPSLGPVTLETAVALHRARTGSLAAAGGQVSRIKLLGYIPTFAAVEAENLGALRLGALPSEPAPGDTAAQILAECEVKPAWVQHELMFVLTP